MFTDFSIVDFDFFLAHFEARLIVHSVGDLIHVSQAGFIFDVLSFTFRALNNPLFLEYVTSQSLLTSGLTGVFISSLLTTYTLHIGILMS